MAEQTSNSNSNAQNTQPGMNPQMSMLHIIIMRYLIDVSAIAGTKPKEEGFLRSTSEAYVKGMAKEAGEKTADYEATNGQQQLDNAKAEAQVRLILPFLRSI